MPVQVDRFCLCTCGMQNNCHCANIMPATSEASTSGTMCNRQQQSHTNVALHIFAVERCFAQCCGSMADANSSCMNTYTLQLECVWPQTHASKHNFKAKHALPRSNELQLPGQSLLTGHAACIACSHCCYPCLV